MSPRKQTWQQWARAVAKDPESPSRLRPGSLAALTGQDARALTAIVGCLELYAGSDAVGRTGALIAMRALLPALQPSTRWIARELIPFVLEWDDRDRLWNLVNIGEQSRQCPGGMSGFLEQALPGGLAAWQQPDEQKAEG